MTKAKGKPIPKKSKQPHKETESKISRWLENNFKILSYSVLGLALVLRLWLLIELPNMPFSDLHKHPDLDMKFFDEWGDLIAKGDFLTDTVLHPYHNWHKDATDYIGAKSDEEGKALWNHWYGEKTYHQEPLYAFILGIVKMGGGNGHLLMYLLQILSSLFSIWMIMWLGRHYFGAIAGISAGLLFTLYSPGVLFDMVLLRTSFTTTYILVLLFVAEKLMLGRSKPWIFGCLGGIGYLLQTTTLLLWLPLLVRWLWASLKGSPTPVRTTLRHSLQTALGLIGVMSLLVIRNSIVGAPLLSASSVGPVTFVLSNFPNYKPELGFAVFEAIGKLLQETDGKMVASALRILEVFPSTWDWVNLEFQKLAMVFHWYEVPNNVNTYLANAYSLPLRLAFIPWSFIAAAGLVGMIFNVTNKRTMNLLFGVLSQVAVMVLFYVLCRFRVPLVAIMAIYAGYVIQNIMAPENKIKSAMVLVSCLLLWFVMMRPYPDIRVPFAVGEMANCFQTHVRDKLDLYTSRGDFKKAIEVEERFIRSQPEYVKHLEKHQPITNDLQRGLLDYYGKLYGDLGDLYKDGGYPNEAEKSYAMEVKLRSAAGLEK